MARSHRPVAGKRVQKSQDGVRSSAAWVLERTLASLAPAQTFLQGPLERLEPRDRGLLVELVLGTLRWLRRLDAVIAAASHRKLDEIDPPLRAPLRIATYQLLFLDRIPAHAAVNEAVDHAGRLTHRGGASFVNAVLRRIARSPRLDDWPVRESDPVRKMAIELSHPQFLVERWLERFGKDRTLAVLQANNRPKPMHLLGFCDRGGRELLAESLIDEGLEVEPSNLSPMGLIVRDGDPTATEAFARGDFYIQDEASQVAALIPPPRPGERILDAAAAPGGKAFALVAKEPTLQPVMADADPGRVRLLAKNLTRLGRRLPVAVADVARPPWSTLFDRVVLDLPCTGTGTFRKHPELKWRISESEVGRLADRAHSLLRGAAPLVAEGGLLVAITCSLEAEENEEVVARFLEDEPEFALLPLEDLLEPPVRGALRGTGFVRIFPGGDHDGFSIHVLRRGGGGTG